MGDRPGGLHTAGKQWLQTSTGQLEVFPNCKAYVTSGEHSLYNGHRLPMQAGSYLLNQDLQMLWGNQETFVQHWQFAQGRNSLDTKAMERHSESRTTATVPRHWQSR
jgi:hypothetical protein